MLTILAIDFMKNRISIHLSPIVFLILLLLQGCKKEEIEITGIDIFPKRVQLNVDSSASLHVIFYPEGTYDRVEWSSTNPYVANIDETGTIKALKLGKSIIKATVQGFTKECSVDVLPHIYSSGDYAIMDGEKELKRVDVKTIVRADEFHNIYMASAVSTAPMRLSFRVQKGDLLYTLYEGDANSWMTAFECYDSNLYTAIDVWDNYQTFNRHSRLYKNGTLYHLFSESHKDICLRTVCANGSDIYSGGYIYDGRSHAAVWKNKELLYTLYNTSDGCWVKSIAVEGSDVYSLVQTSDKGGQFLVYKNDQLIFNTSIYSSSTNIIVNGGRVYLVLGTNKNADIIVDGSVVKSLTIPKSSGDSNLSLYEASLCGDDLYILGTCYKSPRIWQNGNLLYTLPATCTNHQYISVVP